MGGYLPTTLPYHGTGYLPTMVCTVSHPGYTRHTDRCTGWSAPQRSTVGQPVRGREAQFRRIPWVRGREEAQDLKSVSLPMSFMPGTSALLR